MSLQALHDFEVALLDPILAMTERGVRIDEVVRQQMLKDLHDAIEPLSEEVEQFAVPHIEKAATNEKLPRANLFARKWTCKACRNGSKKKLLCEACNGVGRKEWLGFSPTSGDQVKILLYDVLRLPERTMDGKRRSDEDALKSLLAHDTSGVVAKLLTLAKHSTMHSQIERVAPGPDGRLRTFYNPAGTETGRFSSSGGKPFPTGTEGFALEVSTNLQNLASKVAATSPMYNVKRCIIADPDESLLYADLSQAEARVVAALCLDEQLLRSWERADFDVHRWTASKIFNKKSEAVTKRERGLGKVARHALNYGMRWPLFQTTVNADAALTGIAITAAEAKEIVAAYHRLHPSLEMWWRRVAGKLDESAVLETCFGRRRMFFGRRNEEDAWLDATHREAIAFEPQATVADLLNRGLLRWWRRHDPQDGKLLLQIHDAVMVGVPTERATKSAVLLKAALEEPIIVNGVRVLIPAEVERSETSWAEMRAA